MPHHKVKNPPPTISQNLALYRVAQDRRLRQLRRDMRRLEWAVRWKRFKRWLQSKPPPDYYVIHL